MTPPDRQALMAAAREAMVAAAKRALEAKGWNVWRVFIETILDAALAEAAPAGTGTQVGELIEQARAVAAAGNYDRDAILAMVGYIGQMATALETLTRERNEARYAAECAGAELRSQLEARPTTVSGEMVERAARCLTPLVAVSSWWGEKLAGWDNLSVGQQKVAMGWAEDALNAALAVPDKTGEK